MSAPCAPPPKSTIEAGGGQLAVVTYQISVDEDLRGETAMVKGVRVAEIRMLGKQKTVQLGSIRSVAPLPDMPVLIVGQTYLVFTTTPSGIGLSTTVGLGQGSFKLYGKGDSQMAVNEVNNAGLFRDMQAAGGRSRRGAASRTAVAASRRADAVRRAPRADHQPRRSREVGVIMTTDIPFLAFGALTLLLLTSVQVYAGGPLLLRAPGAPFLWPNGGRMIPFNPDQGGLGPLTNAQAVAQSTRGVPGLGGRRLGDRDARQPRAAPGRCGRDELRAVPRPDRTGWTERDRLRRGRRHLRPALRTRSGVLGFAGPEWINSATGDIIEGVAFMNGGALLGADAFPVAEFLSVQVHEYGHYQNLAHTVVNGQIVAGPDSRGPSPFNTFPPPPSFAGRIETMYPFLFINGGQATPHAGRHRDLLDALSGADLRGDHGTITGNIVAPNNTTPVTGVNVIARNIANPYDDAVSAISSDFTDNFALGEPVCRRLHAAWPDAGRQLRRLRGRDPRRRLQHAAAQPAARAGGVLQRPARIERSGHRPAGERLHARRRAGGHHDVRHRHHLQPPPARPDPGGRRDVHRALPERSQFEFCGQRFDSVFVNSNGNLTFGAGSLDFSETIADMLTGPPRIAGLWDDLNAAAGPGP